MIRGPTKKSYNVEKWSGCGGPTAKCKAQAARYDVGGVSPKTSGWLVCDLVDGGQYPKVGEEKANEEIS